jgi:hypothetical protein
VPDAYRDGLAAGADGLAYHQVIAAGAVYVWTGLPGTG